MTLAFGSRNANARATHSAPGNAAHKKTSFIETPALNNNHAASGPMTAPALSMAR
jgi:hypothetical protein